MKLNNKVVILSIGDEILIGQIINTNASWMAEILNKEGFNTISIMTSGDSYESIFEGLNYASKIGDIVLVTGGLGPTKDDITKNVVCDYFNSKLVIHEKTFSEVQDFFLKRGRELTEINRLQAMVPDNCEVISNPVGTAPGMYFQKDNVHFVFMPGVPFEMKSIMSDWVIPEFKKKVSTNKIFQKTVLTHGIGESFLAELIESWEDNLPGNVSLAYLPSPGKVRLRLRAIGDESSILEHQVNDCIHDLKNLIPELIFGYDDDTMESELARLLTLHEKTISTAESCTGGYIAHKITEVLGSSEYFLGSVVSYSNEAKINLLGVSAESIENHGAVSEEVVKEMAVGALNKFETDYAIATSGIAGPGGGTEDKPVGTVWIALADKNKCIAKRFQFGDHRLRNINMTTVSAMNMLRLILLEKELVSGH